MARAKKPVQRKPAVKKKKPAKAPPQNRKKKKKKKKKVVCNRIAGKVINYRGNGIRARGQRNSKSSAEEALLNKIADEGWAAMGAGGGATCDKGTCAGGASCWMDYNLSGPIRFSKIKRPGSRRWIAYYIGTATFFCACY